MPSLTCRRHSLDFHRLRGVVVAFAATAAIAALTTLLAADAHSSIGWTGNYETGDFSQWVYGVQQKAAGRATIVRSPVRQGSYSARYEVDPGDNNVAGSGTGERTEALLSQSATDAYEGREQWWAWSTYWDPSFQSSTSGWNYFTQFHHTGSTGQVNVAWASPGNSIILRLCNGSDPSSPNCQYWTMDSNRQNGRWYDFVFHVKWSSDPAVGFVEVWENGQNVVPLTKAATMYPGQGVYLKQGYYRAAQTTTAIIYHDGMRRGTSYQDVVADFPAGTWPGDPGGSSGATLPPPTIAGSAVVGSTLTATLDASSLPGDPISVGYQWRSCDSSGSSCVDLAGATGPTYVPVTGNVGKTLRVRASAKTSVGTYSATSSQTPAVQNASSTALTVTESIVSGQTLSGKLSWTATPSGTVSRVEFSIDGALKWTEYGAPYVFNGNDNFLDTATLSNGNHTFSVKAYESTGTSASASATATVSNGSTPSLSVSQSIADGQTLSGKLSWTANPNGAVTKVEFSIDGTLKWTESISPYVFNGDGSSLDTATLSNGNHTFSVKAYGSSGATATATATATVSNGSSSTPLSVSSSIGHGQTLSGSVTWTATVTGTVDKVKFYVDDTNLATVSAAPYSATLDTREFKNGKHKLIVKAVGDDGSTATAMAIVKFQN